MSKYQKMKIYNPLVPISCKAWNSPAAYPSWVARCDRKGSDGSMMNPIFWKKVQGQKHPGRWDIAERQIPGVKMLFETNTKGHNPPSVRLFITEQDTIGKLKKTENGIQHRNRTLPQNSPIDCDWVQLHQYWTTCLVYVYIRPITEGTKHMSHRRLPSLVCFCNKQLFWIKGSWFLIPTRIKALDDKTKSF